MWSSIFISHSSSMLLSSCTLCTSLWQYHIVKYLSRHLRHYHNYTMEWGESPFVLFPSHVTVVSIVRSALAFDNESSFLWSHRTSSAVAFMLAWSSASVSAYKMAGILCVFHKLHPGIFMTAKNSHIDLVLYQWGMLLVLNADIAPFLDGWFHFGIWNCFPWAVMQTTYLQIGTRLCLPFLASRTLISPCLHLEYTTAFTRTTSSEDKINKFCSHHNMTRTLYLYHHDQTWNQSLINHYLTLEKLAGMVLLSLSALGFFKASFCPLCSAGLASFCLAAGPFRLTDVQGLPLTVGLPSGTHFLAELAHWSLHGLLASEQVVTLVSCFLWIFLRLLCWRNFVFAIFFPLNNYDNVNICIY